MDSDGEDTEMADYFENYDEALSHIQDWMNSVPADEADARLQEAVEIVLDDGPDAEEVGAIADQLDVAHELLGKATVTIAKLVGAASNLLTVMLANGRRYDADVAIELGRLQAAVNAAQRGAEG